MKIERNRKNCVEVSAAGYLIAQHRATKLVNITKDGNQVLFFEGDEAVDFARALTYCINTVARGSSAAEKGEVQDSEKEAVDEDVRDLPILGEG